MGVASLWCELLVELSHCEELPDGIILVAEELQHLQFHLFATKTGDIFDQHVHTVDDVLTVRAGSRDRVAAVEIVLQNGAGGPRQDAAR